MIRSHTRRGGSARATAIALTLGILTGAAVVKVATPAATSETVAGASWRPARGNGRRFSPEDLDKVMAYAFVDEPWAREVFEERAQVVFQRDGVLGHTYEDHEGELLTIEDGRRTSYEPTDPELTVWFFGGSTMYGLTQRNEHTIPSMIAKLAEEDGIRIRPVNYGVEGYNTYQEALAFSRALTLEPPPDLVVFYHGANDVTTAVERVTVGFLDPEIPYYVAVGPEREERGSSAETAAWTDEERNRAVVDLGAAQYRQAASMADELARGVDVPLTRYWQPTLLTTPEQDIFQPIYDAYGVDEATISQTNALNDSIRTESGVESVDLRGALAGISEPTFFDPEHTNERGAAAVADAMYRDLEGRLRDLIG